jgi:tetratricopeptide (TPR) repeat protein
MEESEKTIHELMVKGKDFDQEGDHESALQTYEIVVSKDNLFFDGWLNKGIQQFKLNKLDLAVKTFQRALVINPDDPVTSDLLKQLDNLLDSPIGIKLDQ